MCKLTNKVNLLIALPVFRRFAAPFYAASTPYAAQGQAQAGPQAAPRGPAQAEPASGIAAEAIHNLQSEAGVALLAPVVRAVLQGQCE